MGAPRLTDGIVVLDMLTLDDVVDHLSGEDDEHARRFGWYPKRSTEQTVEAAIRGWQEEWEHNGATRTLGAREASTGKLVGGCELRLQAPGRASVAYWTFPESRGRGFASRALRLLCDYAFRELSIEEISAHADADNLASLGVMRSVGFVEQRRGPNGVLCTLRVQDVKRAG